MIQFPIDPLGRAGLKFFARTTASISHELKNALAIIKENAGLLEDYLLMAEKGRPVEPEKFKRISNRIGAQTIRADELIKKMNRFAHSADDFNASIDLNELVELLSALSHREVAMRQVTLDVVLEQSAVPVTTAPFLLLTLLGRCLTFSLDAALPGSRMTMHVMQGLNGGSVGFEQLGNMNALSEGKFPDADEIVLLNALGASFKMDRDQGMVLISAAD